MHAAAPSLSAHSRLSRLVSNYNSKVNGSTYLRKNAPVHATHLVLLDRHMQTVFTDPDVMSLRDFEVAVTQLSELNAPFFFPRCLV